MGETHNANNPTAGTSNSNQVTGAQGEATTIRSGSPFVVTFSDVDLKNAAATEAEAREAFFKAGYTYDDAETLSAIWEALSPDEVKVEAGNTVLQGRREELDRLLADPKSAMAEADALQAYWKSGYTYEDAESLVKIWDGMDTSDAKHEAGMMILDGKAGELDRLLKSPEGAAAEAQALQAFWKAGYTYEDAAALVKIWDGMDTSDAKYHAGTMLLKGQGPKLDQLLKNPAGAAAEAQALQMFWKAGFDYEDAKLLADVWKMGPSDAKVVAGEKILDGNRQAVDDALKATEADPEGDALRAYWKAGYTYEDAKVLAGIWEELDIGDCKVEAGMMLIDGKGAEVAQLLKNPEAADREGDALRMYWKAGYTYEDAKVLADAWAMDDPGDAKAAAGEKLLEGDAQAIDYILKNRPQLGENALQAFWKAGYTYEDAKIIGEAWDMSPSEAKVYVGNKVLKGNSSAADYVLKNAGNADHEALEAFYNSRYTYTDAQQLAGLWALADPEDAKVRIGTKVIDGNTSAIDAALKNAQRDPDQEALEAYRKSHYSYTDAERLARVWHMEYAEDAKIVIGTKILKGETSDLDAALKNAPDPDRDRALGAYWGLGYGYEEAKILAGTWQMPVDDAKALAGEKILGGNTAAVQAALKNDGDAFDAGALEAYWEAGYGYEDAKLLAGFWNLGANDAKVFAGEKIMAGDRASVEFALKNAPDPDANARNAFWKAGYTYEDAHTIGEAWDMSPSEAKVYVGNKILNGNASAAEAVLKNAHNANHEAQLAYTKSRYSYDDAEQLAGVWGLSDAAEAKILIGEKLLHGNSSAIDAALKNQ